MIIKNLILNYRYLEDTSGKKGNLIFSNSSFEIKLNRVPFISSMKAILKLKII